MELEDDSFLLEVAKLEHQHLSAIGNGAVTTNTTADSGPRTRTPLSGLSSASHRGAMTAMLQFEKVSSRQDAAKQQSQTKPPPSKSIQNTHYMQPAAESSMFVAQPPAMPISSSSFILPAPTSISSYPNPNGVALERFKLTTTNTNTQKIIVDSSKRPEGWTNAVSKWKNQVTASTTANSENTSPAKSGRGSGGGGAGRGKRKAANVTNENSGTKRQRGASAGRGRGRGRGRGANIPADDGDEESGEAAQTPEAEDEAEDEDNELVANDEFFDPDVDGEQPRIDSEAVREWIYPTNMPVREYQEYITRKALFKNTLVSLPTGLGKTFIAAVVMYNFYRWYPTGKVVFMAPMRPLVAQQIEACHYVTGIPQSDTTEMNGQTPPTERRRLWREKRVIFATPQVVTNDINRGYCPARQIVCVVFDEAHRAKKNYSYCHVVRAIAAKTTQFRVLALTATPGKDITAVQEVVDNLRISHMEIRSEDDLDVRQYVHGRQTLLVPVSLGSELTAVRNGLLEIARPYFSRLTGMANVMYGRPKLETAKKSLFVMTSKRFAKHAAAPQVMPLLSILTTLYDVIESLTFHGLRPCMNKLDDLAASVAASGSTSSLKSQVVRSTRFTELQRKVADLLAAGVRHPKFDKLEELLVAHFQNWKSGGEADSNDESTRRAAAAADESEHTTRAIVFVQWRDSVQEIVDLLRQHSPLITPIAFVGQGRSARTTRGGGGGGSGRAAARGLSQKEQKEVLRRFRTGEFNTLVATCIGEEGLDIGEVDLIVCFDNAQSPVQMVQRMGRTGRKRDGRCVMLLTEGFEEAGYHGNVKKKKSVAKAIVTKQHTAFSLFEHNPRMVPKGVKPALVKKPLVIPKFRHDATTTAGRKRKRAVGYGSASAKWEDPPEYADPTVRGIGGVPRGGLQAMLNKYPDGQSVPSPIFQIPHSYASRLLVSVASKCQQLAIPSDTESVDLDDTVRPPPTKKRKTEPQPASEVALRRAQPVTSKMTTLYSNDDADPYNEKTDDDRLLDDWTKPSRNHPPARAASENEPTAAVVECVTNAHKSAQPTTPVNILDKLKYQKGKRSRLRFDDMAGEPIGDNAPQPISFHAADDNHTEPPVALETKTAPSRTHEIEEWVRAATAATDVDVEDDSLIDKLFPLPARIHKSPKATPQSSSLGSSHPLGLEGVLVPTPPVFPGDELPTSADDVTSAAAAMPPPPPRPSPLKPQAPNIGQPEAALGDDRAKVQPTAGQSAASTLRVEHPPVVAIDMADVESELIDNISPIPKPQQRKRLAKMGKKETAKSATESVPQSNSGHLDVGIDMFDSEDGSSPPLVTSTAKQRAPLPLATVRSRNGRQTKASPGPQRSRQRPKTRLFRARDFIDDEAEVSDDGEISESDDATLDSREPSRADDSFIDDSEQNNECSSPGFYRRTLLSQESVRPAGFATPTRARPNRFKLSTRVAVDNDEGIDDDSAMEVFMPFEDVDVGDDDGDIRSADSHSPIGPKYVQSGSAKKHQNTKTGSTALPKKPVVAALFTAPQPVNKKLATAVAQQPPSAKPAVVTAAKPPATADDFDEIDLLIIDQLEKAATAAPAAPQPITTSATVEVIRDLGLEESLDLPNFRLAGNIAPPSHSRKSENAVAGSNSKSNAPGRMSTTSTTATSAFFPTTAPSDPFAGIATAVTTATDVSMKTHKTVIFANSRELRRSQNVIQVLTNQLKVRLLYMTGMSSSVPGAGADYVVSHRLAVLRRSPGDIRDNYTPTGLGPITRLVLELSGYCARVVVLVESQKREERIRYTLSSKMSSQYAASLATLVRIQGSQLIFTESAEETAAQLQELAWVENEAGFGWSTAHSNSCALAADFAERNQKQIAFVASLPLVGFGLAIELLRRVKTVSELCAMSAAQLMERYHDVLSAEKASLLAEVFVRRWG